MSFALVNTDGEIVGIENIRFEVHPDLRFVEIPQDQDVTREWTYDGGQFVAPQAPTTEELMERLRDKRDTLLRESDRTSLSDYPHANDEARQAWLDYRQKLRDLPANTDDLNNPQFPLKPE